MIDLSSDTATRPTTAMRQAMAQAEVGDEQKGEDPTVNHLSAMVAQLLGKQAALFLPSGTMCNHIAIKVHTQPGDAILVDHNSHILRSESGGAAFLAGVIVEPLSGERGRFTPEQLKAAITTGSLYQPATRLVCLEQTHNFGGGTVWPLAQLERVCEVAHSAGLATHLDGARLFNAVIATGVSASQFAKPFDSVWIDFTKGLGAPLGAVLVGNSEFIAKARRYKHIFGGALRQAGIVAAGCLYALQHHIERLQEDHTNARHLAESLAKIAGVEVDQTSVQTNMVFFNTRRTGLAEHQFVAELGKQGVRMGMVGSQIRAVTHLDITREDITRATLAIQELFASRTRL